jgi:glycosyltransferase involved in cell wall biosynthesis
MLGPKPGADLISLAAELAIAERIEWQADPDDEQLAHAYQCAQVMLFPSLYEGFGWPLLEAMAFSLPVVASNRGSIPEVLGSELPVFEPDDFKGMARITDRLISDPAYAQDAADRGLRRLVEYNSSRFANQMSAVYAAAIGRRSVGGGAWETTR